MATLILGTVGSVLGGHLFGTVGAAIGYTAMASVGGMIDSQTGRVSVRRSQGIRLSDLQIQSSSYGKVINTMYGTCRIAGNIIWSLPIQERVNVIEQRAKTGKGRKRTVGTHTEYSYYATFAIALCKGEIQRIDRVWVDCEEIALSSLEKYRIYYGSEDQMPDSLMEAAQGVGKTPAYRGLAYIVIEDFPITQYGNRVPNFTFEVTSRAKGDSKDNIEDQISSIVVIPGAGEFVYDTIIQYKCIGSYYGNKFIHTGNKQAINCNNNENIADAVLSLKQLQNTCKNIKWISPVVAWFANSLDIRICDIMPGVEYQDLHTITEPDLWKVANFSRQDAHRISYHTEGYPNYGGTVNDASIVRYLDIARREHGYKILFYPMLFCDIAHKPWRGRISGSASQVSKFFHKKNGYNDFILHYARLVKDKVDGFIIGSELVGITSIRDHCYNFPAVQELMQLAVKVKEILGKDVVVTYAADWTEYHHDMKSRYYHLDPLWACDAIDVIGIDAYFPLTNDCEEQHNVEAVIEGWKSGEGYDCYYTDSERCHAAKLADRYAWKNIDWWWNNRHINPDGKSSEWIPKSKKVWFTEYGFPSVDCATNQPNIFVDHGSSEGGYPRYSSRKIDFVAQKTGILGTEIAWSDSEIVENKFLWCWDARPYPFWPAYKHVWRDYAAWKTGHWINGKTGIIGLASVIQDLCLQAGMLSHEIDVHNLRGINITGFVINDKHSARDIIELLAATYFFRAYDIAGILTFKLNASYDQEVREVDKDDLVVVSEYQDLITITKRSEYDLPVRTEVTYVDAAMQYQLGHVYREYNCGSAMELVNSICLPVVLNEHQACDIASQILYDIRVSKTDYQFHLSSQYMDLNIGNVISVNLYNKEQRMRIVSINHLGGHILEVKAISCYADLPNLYYNVGDCAISQLFAKRYGRMMRHEIVEIPVMDGGGPKIFIAVCPEEDNWKGCVFYNTEQESQAIRIEQSSIMGNLIGDMSAEANICCIDYASDSNIDIVLLSGELESIEDSELILGRNLAIIGDEIIQFRCAISTKKNYYRLSGVIRGCLGTEHAMDSHEIGERFILLDRSLTEIDLKDSISSYYGDIYYKIVSVGDHIDKAETYNYRYKALAFKPYAPSLLWVDRIGECRLRIRWCGSYNYGEDEFQASQSQYNIVLKYEDGEQEEVVVSDIYDYIWDLDHSCHDFVLSVARLSPRVGEGYYLVYQFNHKHDL